MSYSIESAIEIYQLPLIFENFRSTQIPLKGNFFTFKMNKGFRLKIKIIVSLVAENLNFQLLFIVSWAKQIEIQVI